MKTVSFKVKDDIFTKMQTAADRNGLSVSAWIRIFIIDALQKADSSSNIILANRLVNDDKGASND